MKKATTLALIVFSWMTFIGYEETNGQSETGIVAGALSKGLGISVASAAEIESNEDVFEVELMETDGLGLIELVVAEGVSERKPVNPNVQFELGQFERLYAFVKVKNPEAVENEVNISWSLLEENAREIGGVDVSIGAQKRWRTWSFTRAVRKAGKWQVIVRNKDGAIIGKAAFKVVDPS